MKQGFAKRLDRWAMSIAWAACMAAASMAHAQGQGPAASYPAGPVTMVVPTSPGTSSDIVARAISQKLTPLWKQSIVVDNRTGASGSIGISAVARAPADGQTILVVTNTVSMLPSLSKDITWKPADLAPVALMGSTVTALVVNPALPVKNVDELIALAKAQPGKLNYATPGIGTPHHLYTELFKEITGTDIFHVPYSSTAGAVTDIAGGRAQIGFFPLNAVMPLIRGNKIRVLATAGEQRTSSTPDAPTFTEAHIDGVHAGSWIGVFVPRATPKPVIDKLSDAITALLKDPGFQQELLRQEVVPNAHPGGPAQLGELLASDTARWKKVIDTAKIVGE